MTASDTSSAESEISMKHIYIKARVMRNNRNYQHKVNQYISITKVSIAIHSKHKSYNRKRLLKGILLQKE